MAKKPNPIVAHINKGIANLKAVKADIAHDIRRMQESRRKYHHILNHIVSPANDNGGYINVNRYGVSVTYYDLEGFKDLRLETTLEGLNFIGEIERTREYASVMNRDYIFRVPFADGTSMSVTVCAYVKEDSPTCRKIVVGQEIQTVDKYEIVCD